MLFALLAVQLLTLAALVVLALRRGTPAGEVATDARLAALLAADLPAQMARLDARAALLDDHVRGEFAAMQREAQERAQRATVAAETASVALRAEVLGSVESLRKTMGEELNVFRGDNKLDAERLRGVVEAQIKALTDALTAFTTETSQRHIESRDVLHTNLKQLGREQTEQSERLRGTVEQRLEKLNAENTAKLEEMRATVDEKLQATLHTRLTESFGAVTEQLTKVHSGLGEMTTLASGVGDLKRVLSNVKSRGIVGEFFLGQQLEQMFSAEQYATNVRVKDGSLEAVEFALKVPNGPDSTVWLALDSKFPVEDWERLEDAYERGSDEDRKRASTAFERSIRTEGKRICEKYIDPPNTLPFAIMYLPTEALYAEVMRRPGLHAEVQSQCNVVIAGPSAFTMILTSFQLVFRTVKFQKNLHEVWKVFQVAQKEFDRFGGMMERVEKQVVTVQNTLGEISGKSKTVSRAFRNVSKLDLGAGEPIAASSAVSQNVLEMLAANEED
jgi:DNA recombination protein RmuC